MPIPNRNLPKNAPLIVLIPVVVGSAIVAGVAFVQARREARLDHSPAPVGTPQLDARVPIGLWSATGDEPVVAAGVRGWRTMAAHLYHRDTRVDDAGLARAVVLSQFSRRAADARRAVAFEVSVLLGRYEPSIIAAAWLSPQVAAPDADHARYREFGISAETVAILAAESQLDADLAPVWAREVGVDALRRDFTEVGDLTAEERAKFGALVIDAAIERLHARVR